MAKKKKPSPKSAKKSKQQPSAFKFILKWAFVLGLWAGVAVLAVCAYYAAELPDITENATFERKSSIIVKDADGEIVAHYGDITGNRITIDDIPPHLVHAVLATEDRRFYKHFGVDLIGLARAMFTNVQEQRLVQGGSTITQQLAKNLFLSRERTLKRKIQEAMLAIWLEHELTKDEILSAYLNRVYLGSGTYGVDAASKLYFKKPVQEITIREAATLAGLLKAPSRYSPRANPSLSRQRTDVVIEAMIDAGYLSQDEQNNLITKIPTPNRKPSGTGERYYTDWIVDQIDDLIGTPKEDLIIETTMNARIQSTAEEALAKVIREHGEEKHMTQGAVVVMRPTGAVVAIVGGKDYGQSQFNRATQALRQPGSSFKPFVYLTALEHGWRPTDTILDEPIMTGRYRPKNFNNEYYGEVDLLTALTFSLNTVSYQLTKQLTPHAVIDTARRLGVDAELNPDLSLALGTNQISPLDLTGAYASIANGGVTVQPYGITKITSEDGTVYYQRADNKKGRRAVNGESIGMLITMMESVIENGTGRGANFGAKASGKTGTSQESRDAWFMGFTDRLVTGVWLGNDDNTPMKRVTGGSYPATVWRTVMSQSNGMYAPYRHNVGIFDGFQSLLDRLGGGSRNNEPENYTEPASREEVIQFERKADIVSTPESQRYNN